MQKKVIIVSAPSGSGKTMLTRHLLEKRNDVEFSVSATTRKKRDHLEKQGKDYYFFTPEEFREKIKNNELIEWEEVYEDRFYGTLRFEIERIWKANKNIIFDVDVKGGVNLKKYFQKRALSVFVKAPSIEVLKERLVNRGTETKESLAKRLSKVKFEMTFENRFDKVLINDDAEKSKKEILKLYDDFKKK